MLQWFRKGRKKTGDLNGLEIKERDKRVKN